MEINALDQLFRSEQSGSSTARRPSESSDKRFSNLLEAQSARARVERPAQRSADAARRQDDPAVKTARAERPEGEDRAERKDASERTERKGRPERAQKKEAAAEKPAASEKSEVSEKLADVEKVDSAEDGKLADAAKKAVAAEAPVPATDADEKADAAALAVSSDPVAALAVVKVDAPAPVAVPVAPVVEIQAETETKAEDSETDASAAAKATPVAGMSAGEDAKSGSNAKAAADAKAAAAQIALPTSTLAETAKHAEPTTEDYADFMLRNAAATAALPATEAGKEAVKSEADTAAKEGKLIVTIAQPAAIAAPVAPITAFAVQAVVSNDNAALDASLAARAPVELDDAKAPVKTAEPTNLFAQNLDSARAVQTTEEPKPVARTPLVPPHEQVAVHIRKAVADGLDQISIRLNPLELGRIDIKLDIAADGSLRAAFAADRQQTLELLKNDSRQLENALSEAGLRADSGGLNFSLRGDNRENAQAFRDMGAQFANRRGAGDDTDNAASAVAAGYVRPRAGNGRIDLNA